MDDENLKPITNSCRQPVFRSVDMCRKEKLCLRQTIILVLLTCLRDGIGSNAGTRNAIWARMDALTISVGITSRLSPHIVCLTNEMTSNLQGRKRSLRLYLVRHGESEANERGVFAGQLDSPLTDQGIKDAKSLGEKSEFLILEPSMQSQTDEPDRNEPVHHPYRFDSVYSSDLIRAHDTCKLILGGMQTQEKTSLDRQTQDSSTPLRNVHLDVRLRERSYGTLQGMPWSSDRNETDKMWRETHDEDDLPPIFETDDDIWIRVKEFLSDLIRDEWSNVKDEAGIKHILITSHGGVLRQILMRLVGVEKLKKMGAEFDTKRKNRLITPNTSLSILQLSEDEGTSHETTVSLEGIRAEMVLFANTDHLKDGVRLHDD